MKTIRLLFLVALLNSFLLQETNAQNFNTDQLNLEDEVMISKILDKMSVEEKVGQTCQITLESILKKDKDNKLVEPHQIDNQKLKIAVKDFKVGSFLNVSNHTFDLERWHEIIKTVQTEAMSSKLGIPIIYGIDAIHGVTYTRNSTLFPTRNWTCCYLGCGTCQSDG